MARFLMAPAAILALAALLLATGGCEPERSWTSYQEAGFDAAEALRQPCAVGGVVLRTGIALDRFAAVPFAPDELTPDVQAGLWAPLLDDAFRVYAHREPAVGWFTYASRVPAAVRDAILGAHAAGGLVPPAVLEECRQSLPDVRYLLLARVEETILGANFRGDYGSDKSTGRRVLMTLDIYDLEGGLSVWTHTTSVFDGGPRNPGDDEAEELRRLKLPAAQGDAVGVPGQVLTAPPLEKLMADCLRKLIRIASGNIAGGPGG